jgi:2-keto-4-pentenoate hydratase/2-oxohepta-3-ene-1,7-dioic acid hydratase in catechol pathway
MSAQQKQNPISLDIQLVMTSRAVFSRCPSKLVASSVLQKRLTNLRLCFAKAFDKFAPLGPTLISAHLFDEGKGSRLTTRINGKVVQRVDIMKDIIFSPARILSFMSQGSY